MGNDMYFKLVIGDKMIEIVKNLIYIINWKCEWNVKKYKIWGC